jgi:hypothetical protein
MTNLRFDTRGVDSIQHSSVERILFTAILLSYDKWLILREGRARQDALQETHYLLHNVAISICVATAANQYARAVRRRQNSAFILYRDGVETQNQSSRHIRLKSQSMRALSSRRWTVISTHLIPRHHLRLLQPGRLKHLSIQTLNTWVYTISHFTRHTLVSCHCMC